MITAIARGNDDGKQRVLLGLTRRNIERLLSGRPISVKAETHPGFPEDLQIMIIYGESERAITDVLSGHIGEKTKIVAVPREDKERKPS